MKGEIELYNISFLILKVELHFKALTFFHLTSLNSIIAEVVNILSGTED